MNRSRWICLVIVALYVVMVLKFPLPGDGPAAGSGDRESAIMRFADAFLLFLGFVCVWWSEILGDALWMGRGAWNPQPSSAGAVQVLGWVFLVGAFVLHAILWHRIAGNGN